jgi:hypothetical protein
MSKIDPKSLIPGVIGSKRAQVLVYGYAVFHFVVVVAGGQPDI